jgi:hypothetical protein
MTPAEITAHLDRFREKQDRLANEERARQEQEQAVFRANCEDCENAIKGTVEPLLGRLSHILKEHGHESFLRPIQETEHITERTKLKSIEYACSIEVDRPKGLLILRVAATPQSRQLAATIGVPHGNCSSVFHAANGPLNEAEEITNRGIADFMAAAFPTR